MAMLSMRMTRLDVCKKLLPDDPPAKPTQPDEMDGGKTPIQHKKPNDPPIPEPPSPRTTQDILKYKLDLSKCKAGSGDVIDTLLNIARWLMNARSTEAVDLFCDVARMFTAHDPPIRISDDRYSLLRTLSDVMLDFSENTTRKRPRAATNPGNNVNINFDVPGPSNWEYSRDTDTSRRALMAGLRQRMEMDTDHPDPAEKHGLRLSSHGTAKEKQEQTNRRPEKLPRSATHIIAYTVAMERRSALSVDPSNLAANREPREDRKEIQEEVERITREMEAVYEGKLREWERAEEER
ncbi:hypothetical protein FQN55_002576, partial [Onygenales sp. PD_40]